MTDRTQEILNEARLRAQREQLWFKMSLILSDMLTYGHISREEEQQAQKDLMTYVEKEII